MIIHLVVSEKWLLVLYLLQESLCACDDITEALRPARVSLTVQHLDQCPRLTPTDFAVAKLCILLFMTTCLAVILGYLWCVETNLSANNVSVISLLFNPIF
jgi:hypothetical protein